VDFHEDCAFLTKNGVIGREGFIRNSL